MNGNYALVYPMFAMVCLTAFVLVRMFRARVRAVREGAVTPGYFKTYQGQQEPPQSAQIARHFTNLFEAPTLFYVACVTAMVVQVQGLGIVLLAWLYVAVRLLHAFIHLGSNKLNPRIQAYAFSWLVLLTLWGWIVVAVASGPRFVFSG
jgi:hypothetical protein